MKITKQLLIKIISEEIESILLKEDPKKPTLDMTHPSDRIADEVHKKAVAEGFAYKGSGHGSNSIAWTWMRKDRIEQSGPKPYVKTFVKLDVEKVYTD